MEPIKTDLVVLGAGPGGYAAAFYAADRGKKVILVEQEKRLGGICLNRGCIPSKALLHASKILREAKEAQTMGISFAEPKINVGDMRTWKEGVLDKLSSGISMIGKGKNVTIMHGRGYFMESDILRVETPEGQKFVQFDKAIIAVGSLPAIPSDFDLGNPRIMTSSEALEIKDIPKDLLVIGGGYIGLELGTVYATLGSNVVLVEALDSILTGVDSDLARPIIKYIHKNFKEVRLSTKVIKMATDGQKIKVIIENEGKKITEHYDKVLVAVGRVPNSKDLGLEHTKVQKTEKGFIKVNERQETDDSRIYAIGDIAGGILLAHKASKEAHIAVDVICGEDAVFQEVIMPAVVFTDPEVAWCGITETDARKTGLSIKTAKFSWGASGRALTLDRPDGMTKIIIDPETERILGVGMVGHGAGELISEAVLAIEMGATVEDLVSVVHPHPTLSETLKDCAEIFTGHPTHALTKSR